VLIGTEMDHDALRERLTDCLLTDDEMDADWSTFEDRFPTFELPEEAEEAEADHDHPADSEGQEEIGLAD